MNYTKTLMIVLILLAAFSCKKGDTGPAGKDGNANVKMYTYGPQTFTGVYNYVIPGITQGQADSCIFLAYYVISTELATTWYPVPGLGSGGIFDTRSFVNQSSISPAAYALSVRILKPDGSASYPNPVTFSKFKIVVISPSAIVAAGRVAAPVDYSDYYAVKKYYNLQD